jgi:hypothetical protein
VEESPKPCSCKVRGSFFHFRGCLLVEERQATRLDALARRGVGRQRIVERGVEGEPGAAVVGAVVDADQDRFVGLHLREVEPAMAGIVLDGRGLAANMRVDEIARDRVVVGEAPQMAMAPLQSYFLSAQFLR